MKDTGEEFYDYSGRERRFRESLEELEGRRLLFCRLQVISPEINVVYLGFADGGVAVQGDIGGELLTLVPVTSTPGLRPRDELGTSVQDFGPAERFLGRRVAQARMVGEAWNGHGLEVAFDGLPNQTLLVSSVECQENKTDVHDALRIAAVDYTTMVEDDSECR